MHIHRNRLILVLLAYLTVSASPLGASVEILPVTTTTFFEPATFYGEDSNGYTMYYLTYFDAFSFYQSDPRYIYKYEFGWLYNFGGTTPTSDDVYLYDFETDDVLYTAANVYPYFYSFNMGTFLYYFAGSYPREFYDMSTDIDILYPLVSTVD